MTRPRVRRVFRLREHTERLMQGARVMRIDHEYDPDSLDSAIIETVRRNGHESCYIRPIIFRGSGAIGLEGRGRTKTEAVIFTMEWGRYLGAEAIEQGVDVQISSFRRMAPDTHMALVKAGGNYVNSQFVSMEAHDNGFQEGHRPGRQRLRQRRRGGEYLRHPGWGCLHAWRLVVDIDGHHTRQRFADPAGAGL